MDNTPDNHRTSGWPGGGHGPPPDPQHRSPRLDALYGLSKAAVLGLGYRMGALKFISTLKMDPRIAPLIRVGAITEKLCVGVVHGYRTRYPKIVAFWDGCDRAFRSALDGIPSSVGPVQFIPGAQDVVIRLPSSREIRYPNARLEQSRREIAYLDRDGLLATFTTDEPEIVYLKDTHIHGGKITENIVQAIACDILVEAILRLERDSWLVFVHVHDEAILQVPADRAEACKAATIAALTRCPAWAPDLPLAAKGKIGESLAM